VPGCSTDPGGAAQRPNTVVVVPSLTIDIPIPTVEQQAYEERMLFLLFILAQPHLRLIYITSLPVPPEIIDYYLDILPGVVASNARRRLFLVSPQDGSQRPLTRKLLERPALLAHIRALIPDPDNAHIVPFNTTDLERELALALGIPMYAADPDLFAFGTKSGGREIFAAENIPHPLGVENLFSEDTAVSAIASLRAQQPDMSAVVVKLNEGVGGMGNTFVPLQNLPAPGHPAEREALRAAFRAMQFEIPDFTYDAYLAQFSAGGGIVEQFLGGEEVRSPSVQLRNTPLGEVQILSTHDQMLGGPSGQTYLGAIFPADPQYGRLIIEQAQKIGANLARAGVIGRYAVDFLVVRNSGGPWSPYAIEINLRKGGTTAPYLTLQYLTRGSFDAATNQFRTLRGEQKFYVSSDHVEAEAYRQFTPTALFDLISAERLHFDHTSQTGIVLHMISSIAAEGRTGVTAVANTAPEAQQLYHRLITAFDTSAARLAATT